MSRTQLEVEEKKNQKLSYFEDFLFSWQIKEFLDSLSLVRTEGEKFGE